MPIGYLWIHVASFLASFRSNFFTTIFILRFILFIGLFVDVVSFIFFFGFDRYTALTCLPHWTTITFSSILDLLNKLKSYFSNIYLNWHAKIELTITSSSNRTTRLVLAPAESTFLAVFISNALRISFCLFLSDSSNAFADFSLVGLLKRFGLF